ncbi:ABC transporter ATP-binding protein [Psychrobium sp. MM17-31]|uniref:ABC transporter ATP-binding protein n=1 Tax=Psychrobium sp. MM17-31 TaxID=2917758 RepID=UPI001EF5E73B|nr:ABC transporter ATP-binding protein [Psychrobium sp. MM17-31]MCG7532009.1 ABC transporter ATP-binding protein [Psychrobium sp. MM17-31]
MSSIIDIKALSFQYVKSDVKQRVLNELSLTINRGQVVCLLGANGAGKSTLINLMLGRLKAQCGDIEIFGQLHSSKEVRQRLGVMLQDSAAPERAKVSELLELFRSYYDQPLPLTQLYSDLQLDGIKDKYFGALSGGQKQLVLLAIALCGDPDLLFLDEPSVGMDVTTRRVLWQVIERYKSLGKTILLTTHYLEEADALSDRIVVLKGGRIIADDTPQGLKVAFSHKLIKAKTSIAMASVRALAGVVNVAQYGNYLEVTTTNAAETLAKWQVLDADIDDLTISNCDLEQAFIQLTQDMDSQQESAA